MTDIITTLKELAVAHSIAAVSGNSRVPIDGKINQADIDYVLINNTSFGDDVEGLRNGVIRICNMYKGWSQSNIENHIVKLIRAI